MGVVLRVFVERRQDEAKELYFFSFDFLSFIPCLHQTELEGLSLTTRGVY